MEKGINDLIAEMRQAYAESSSYSLEETKAAVKRALTKAVIRKGKKSVKNKQDAKSQVRAQRAVDGMANPGEKEIPEALLGYEIYGSTGLNGDGYAVEVDEDCQKGKLLAGHCLKCGLSLESCKCQPKQNKKCGDCGQKQCECKEKTYKKFVNNSKQKAAHMEMPDEMDSFYTPSGTGDGGGE